MNLQSSIQYLPNVSEEKYSLIQSELGIKSIEDLLQFFPNRYVDKTKFYKIKDLSDTQTEFQIVGKISDLQTIGVGKSKRLVAHFQDDTDSMDLVWFRYPNWLKESIKLNQALIVYGKVKKYGKRFSMAHPEMEYDLSKTKSQKLFFPVYPSTEKLQKKGISNRFFQKLLLETLSQYGSLIEENLSQELLQKNNLVSRREAYQNVHFPKNQTSLQAARNRIKYEEIFFFQLSYALQNIQRKQKVKGHVFETVGESFNHFYNNILPFELTGAQKRVIREIRQDMAMPVQMNRLLQGDVGSGKTVVALMSMLLAKDNGFQSTLMAPTEVLAMQHFQSFQELLYDTDVNIALLTGSTSNKERELIFKQLKEGSLDIIVGTHALIESKVQFNNLGFAVIDEQHKFGVKQRSQLWKKNSIPPHMLVMTATPIPRTLALTYYSDLDVSVIDELPKGRKPIQTFHKTDANRLPVFQFLKEEIQKGRQVYVVYPLIEESSQLDYKNLVDGYESFQRAFPDFALSIVHGKMKPEAKEFEMARFKKGETQIMVSTTVIEVGVNVPNASVMLIENAEKFGLSQLHQLRGRVGRGADDAYCFLMTDRNLSDTAYQRIQTMVQTQDGFKISEVDLEMRGPGTILGTKQSGNLGFKISSLTQDKNMFSFIKPQVDALLQGDPQLSKEENAPIRNYFLSHHKNKVAWSRIS